MNYKPYPEYKDSGVEWIDKIPANWKMEKSKHIFKKMNRPPKKNDGVVTAFRDGIVTLREKRREEGFTFSIKEIGYQGIRKGDLVIHGMDGFAGAIGVSDSDGKCSPVYSICLPIHKSNTYYYAYILREMAYSGFITSLARGIRERSTDFRFPVFKELILPVPSLKEQSKIASFLDKKTSEIDKTIEKDKQLIELLKEKRAALINHVVTKGLDPDAKMKDSGVEWIGEIPEGWKIEKLKFISSINKESLSENTDPDYEFNYLDISNVSKNGEILNTELVRFENAPSRARRIVKSGDTIISTVRTYLKAIAYLNNIPENFIVSTGFSVLNPDKNIYPKYLYYSISSESFVQTVMAYSKGIAYPAINSTDLANIPFWYPNLEEQKKIASFLDKQTSKIDKTIEKIQTKINLLQEYKKSLIHHVVTGKIDVRREEKSKPTPQKKVSRQTSLTI